MILNLKTVGSLYDRTDTLTRYFRDIRKYRVLSQEEETELFRIYQDENSSIEEKKNAKDLIINSNLRFALSMAKHFATNDNLADLINEAIIGMMIAFEDFKIEKNVKFIHYAVHTMRREINNYCIKHNNIVKKNNISKTYHVVSKATNDFIQQEERKPTLKELASILKNKYKVDIKDLDDLLENQYVSIDFDDNDEEGRNIGEMNLYNSYTANNNKCEENNEKEHAKFMINNLLSQLTPREQTILKLNFGIGYDREYELSEIASKVGLTTERVRQIIATSKEKMLNFYKKAKY